MSEFTPPAEIDYTAGDEESPTDYSGIDEKAVQARAVLRQCLETYDNPALMWTGGKDSTLTLHYLTDVVEELGVDHPPVIFIDHFQHFHTVYSFVDRWSDALGLDVITAKNHDIGEYVEANDLAPGDEIPVPDLDDKNQRHVRDILGLDVDTIEFKLDTEAGNHLLKTVALNDILEQHGFDAVISGVRWDEQEARSEETFFSPRHDADVYPPHDRVHPILQFTEADVWVATWQDLVPAYVEDYDKEQPPTDVTDLPGEITAPELPVLPSYFDGYRSVGSEPETEKSSNKPAWEQKLEETAERQGRAQDKEEMMRKLRNLGYM